MKEQLQKSGLAQASMVMGIIALVLSFIPVVGFMAYPLGILALIFGIVAMKKKPSNSGQAIAGIITGIIGLIVVTIGLILFSAAMKSASDAVKEGAPTTTTSETASPAENKLTLDEGWKFEKGEYFSKVVGSVTNNTDKPVNNLSTITFSGVDASGANVGDCTASINTIDANGRWNFEATCLSDNIQEVRFKSLSGF